MTKDLSPLPSLPPSDNPGFIPPHGGYKDLLSYQKSLVVFQATLYFCDRFIDKKSRTHDQMVQAARSGKQNILEGSEASGTSKETEIKLTGVAKASQKELLEAKQALPQRLPQLLPAELSQNEMLMSFCQRLISPEPDGRFGGAEEAGMGDCGAASIQRQLVMVDLASEYENEIRLWLQDLA